MNHLLHLTASTRSSCLYALTLTDLNRGFVVDRRSAHSLLDLSGHGQEGLLDIRRILGGRLQEGNPQAIGKLL